MRNSNKHSDRRAANSAARTALRSRCVPRLGVNAARRGFTLVELLLAGVITVFVLGAVTTSMSQLGRARHSSKLRFDAYIRADAALNAIRRDIATVMRRDDLFYTRLMLLNDDNPARWRDEYFERDGILVFNTRLRATRDLDFNGEGFEYETQYRVSDDDAGPVLWVRRDVMPDEYPLGGGVVVPAVEGVLNLKFEAYDGYSWYDTWDSDIDGLPLAVRVTVIASGHRDGSDIFTAPRAVLRTVVAIDRVIPPKDLFKDPAEDEEAEGADVPPTDQQGNTPNTGGRPNGGRPTGPGRPNFEGNGGNFPTGPGPGGQRPNTKGGARS